MSNSKSNSELNNLTNEYYGSKYSEFLFPEGRIFSSEINTKMHKEQRQKTELNKENFWGNFKEEISHKYNRPCTISKKFFINLLLILVDKNQNLERQFRLGYNQLFSRANWTRKKRNMTNLTPDEIVTIDLIKQAASKKILYCTSAFYTLGGIMYYFNRSYLGKLYIFSTVRIYCNFTIKLNIFNTFISN